MDSQINPQPNPGFQKIDKVVLLSQCPLFSGLNQWELKSISQLMRLVDYRKGEVVYREGGEGDSFYVIVSGRFEVSISSGDKKKVLAYLRRGDYFGEMSLLTNQPHSATLRALSDALILELKKDDFKKTIEHNATLSLEISKKLSSRVKGGEPRSKLLLKSDIISIYSTRYKSGQDMFSFNLAASLFHETRQKTVLLSLNPAGAEILSQHGMQRKVPLARFDNLEYGTLDVLSDSLMRHGVGFDVLSVSTEQSSNENAIISLINHLAIDYRFIIIDLPSTIDETVFKALTQSDAVYCVTDSGMNGVSETKEVIAKLEKSIAFPEDKISIVVNEALFGIRTTTITRKELFGKKMCFSLPAYPAGTDIRAPFVVGDPDAEYSRVVRHIARYISNNLVGLVLGSGAALGLAHVGVLKVLERERIPIDIIAGSSIGALIAAMYAVGKTADEVEKASMEINTRLHLTRLLDFSIPPVRGLFKGKKIMRHFRSHLGDKTFDHCRIPLKIIGANLSTRQIHLFESGYVWEAVRASIAIPAIFKPVFMNGDVIVDGGIFSPLPIRCLRQAGANKIIAVNVFPTSKDTLERRLMREEADEKEAMLIRQKNPFARGMYQTRKFFMKSLSANVFDILMNTIQSMESEIAEVEGEAADVLLRPVLANANWVEFYKPQQFIKRGEEEAERYLSKIKALVSQQNV